MKSPWQYFELDELRCHCFQCGSTGLEMKTTFMNMIVILRKEMCFPFVITSAYRCPDYNKKVSNTGRTGPHTTGKALDIQVSGEQAWDLFYKSLSMRFLGIGVNQKGTGGRYIHLDMCLPSEAPRPRIWSY